MILKIAVLILAIYAPLSASSQTAPISTDKHDSESIQRELMQTWSRQLGVTCVYCHDLKNLKDASKASHKVALEHQRLVRLINEQVFRDLDSSGQHKIKADCYMCHRGQALPEYKEPRNKLTH